MDFFSLSMNWLFTIEYLASYFATIFGMIVISNSFPKDSNKYVNYAVYVILSIFIILTLITSPKFFTFLMKYFHVLTFIIFLYIFTVNIIAIIKKREGAIPLFIGIIGLIITFANDSLNDNSIIKTVIIFHYGLLMLIFCQSYMLSIKFSKAFFYVEKLTSKLKSKNVELKNLNLNLEKKVEDRTVELVAANAEMKVINDNLIKTRDRLWSEMELAKKIQTVLLPENPTIKGYEIVAYMDPASDVGGDYYDIINCEGFDWIIIGDVSGHGLPAGLVMMMVQTAIHASLERHPDDKPSDLLVAINRTIKKSLERLDEEKYMTITVITAFKEGKFIHSGLHQDIFIYRKNTGLVETLKTNGFWIGIVDNIENFTNESNFKINIGDIILLYTDGITEAWKKGSVPGQRDPENEMYGSEKLLNVFQKHASMDLEVVKDKILESLDSYYCDDDVTMVFIKRVE